MIISVKEIKGGVISSVIGKRHRREESSTDAELIIVKNRFGSTGTLPLHCEPVVSTWREPDQK